MERARATLAPTDTMASSVAALSCTASASRVAPAAAKAAGRATTAGAVRPSRGSAVVAHAEISGLSECGNYQELCKAEIPTKIPRCVAVSHADYLRDRRVTRAWAFARGGRRRRSGIDVGDERIKLVPDRRFYVFRTQPRHRHDFLKQMYRYMIIAFQDNGLAQYGKRMTVDLVDGMVSHSPGRDRLSEQHKNVLPFCYPLFAPEINSALASKFSKFTHSTIDIHPQLTVPSTPHFAGWHDQRYVRQHFRH